MSRPSSSVPNQCAELGPTNRPLKSSRAGSCGASHGANTAHTRKIASRTTPTAAKGCRLTRPTIPVLTRIASTLIQSQHDSLSHSNARPLVLFSLLRSGCTTVAVVLAVVCFTSCRCLLYVVILTLSLSKGKDPEGLDSPRPPEPFQPSTPIQLLPLFVLRRHPDPELVEGEGSRRS